MTSARTLCRHGQALARTGRHDEAVAALGEAVRREPRNGLFHLHLGLVALDAGDGDGARKALKQATRLLPDRPFPLCVLGMLHYDRGEPGEATHALREAQRLDADYHLPVWLLGLVAWAEGDGAAARKALLAAPVIHLDLLDGRLLARIERTLLEAKSKETPAHEALEVEPSISPLRHASVLRLSQGLGILLHPWSAAERDLRSRVIAAQTDFDQQRYEEAVKGYREVAKRRPGDPLWRFRLAEAQLLAGRDADALATLESIALPEPHEEAQRDIEAMRGIAAYRLGRIDEAAKRLALLGPCPAPHIAYYRGLVAVRRNRLDAAARDLVRFTRIVPPRWLRARLVSALEAK